MELPKRYDPKVSEAKWQKYWEEKKVFEYNPDEARETYAIDTPPPTVSGKMHMGHAFSYAQQDIVARYHRMMGKNVFFPFGTDDNGLATAILVEKTKKILSRKYSREEFVKICNDFIKENKPAFVQDWRQIGMSADFTKSYSTISEHCQITSQASFIDLYKKGRVFQQEAPVAWCVKCQTAIAQAEFESVDKNSHFNDIKFMSGDKELIISTTRPELLPACVALFYHPGDERYQELEDKYAVVPVFGQKVPILSDESVDKEKGTGLMMVCTFGDKEDVEKWHKHDLQLRVVFEKFGKMNSLAGEFEGMKIVEARKAILEKLKELGALVGQKEISHAVNVHERCKTPLEFLKTKQWYIKVLDKKQELLDAGNKIKWYPKHMKVRYDHWVQNLNWDWCISRQRHFGIPIPVWVDKKTGGVVLPAMDELPVDPTVDKPKNYTGNVDNLVGEVDVLDTWQTSSITPEIARNWVHQGEYNVSYVDEPMALRPQAHDIIRTWLFYTIVKSWYHFGRVPWNDVVISGHAQDPHGKKMSKSLGNIVEPQKMIEKFSADALRYWAAGSKLGDDLPFQEKDLLTGQKTVNKLWNASKFSIMHLEDYSDGEVVEMFDKWLISKLHRTINVATEVFEKYEYSKAKAETDAFFWKIFCDQYLEIVKDRLYNPDARGVEKRTSGQVALYAAVLGVLKLMAPVMPHITEEIYQLYFAGKEGHVSIHSGGWPTFDPALVDETAEKAGDVGVEIINVVRKWKSEQNVSLKEEISKLVLKSSDADFAAVVSSIEGDLKAVLNAKEIFFEGETSLETAQFGISIGIEK